MIRFINKKSCPLNKIKCYRKLYLPKYTYDVINLLERYHGLSENLQNPMQVYFHHQINSIKQEHNTLIWSDANTTLVYWLG